MKSKNYILSVLAIGLMTGSMVSCSDFLDTKPSTSVDDTDVFQTTSGAQSALNGCYYQMRAYGSGGANRGDDYGIFDQFSSRLKFIGLQGSYKRGEAKQNSDIDIVIILDKLTFEDLAEYKNIVHTMPFHEKVCGFVSGEREIYNWPKFDLFQLANDTISLHGNLYDFIPILKRNDILDSIKVNTANLYHQMCHGYLFENKDITVLYQGYKSAFFILQAVYYARNSVYIGSKKELSALLDGEDKEILLVNINWEALSIEQNSDYYFEKIINWAGKYI